MLSWTPFRGAPSASALHPAAHASLLGLLALAALLLPPVALPFVLALAVTAPLSAHLRPQIARVVVRSAPPAPQILTRGPPA